MFLSSFICLLLPRPPPWHSYKFTLKTFQKYSGCCLFFIAARSIKSSLSTVNTLHNTPPHSYRCAAYAVFPTAWYGSARLASDTRCFILPPLPLPTPQRMPPSTAGGIPRQCQTAVTSSTNTVTSTSKNNRATRKGRLLITAAAKARFA